MSDENAFLLAVDGSYAVPALSVESCRTAFVLHHLTHQLHVRLSRDALTSPCHNFLSECEKDLPRHFRKNLPL